MAAPKGTTIGLWVVVGVLLLALTLLFQNPGEKAKGRSISYTDFLLLEPHVRDAIFHGDVVTGHDDKNAAFSVTVPHDPAIATRLAQNHVAVVIGPPDDSQSWLTTLLVNGLPLIGYYFLVSWPIFRVARALEKVVARRTPASDPPPA